MVKAKHSMNHRTKQTEVSGHLRHQLCFMETQKKEQSAITEKTTREGFTLELAFNWTFKDLMHKKERKVLSG